MLELKIALCLSAAKLTFGISQIWTGILASVYSSPNRNQTIKALGEILCINSIGNDGSEISL